MPSTSQPLGRRERNKRDKLERIVAAAGELFAERGVDEVTTQQIADAADIGTGTLFLYVRTKGELLLLVQNAHYEAALEEGRAAAAAEAGVLDAVLALLRPIVVCNRAQVDNGRTYLREMVFGDPAEPHHATALRIVERTEEALAEIFVRFAAIDDAEALTLATVVSAIQFMAMAPDLPGRSSAGEVIDAIAAQVVTILPR